MIFIIPVIGLLIDLPAARGFICFKSYTNGYVIAT